VIARVFPRKTCATPQDDLVFYQEPGLFPPTVDAVHVSVCFTWDRDKGERLARAWEKIAPTYVGGPAYGVTEGDFEPGIYLKQGYTITSRGCPNKCKFCEVPKRAGALRELPIRDGWIVQDDNLLATSRAHFSKVCEMLMRQPCRADLRGLEARRLTDWHIEQLSEVNPRQLWFAYDKRGDLEPLQAAAKKLLSLWPKGHRLRCYVLVGHDGDTTEKAEKRLIATIKAGYMPFAMLWRGHDGKTSGEWRKFQRVWARGYFVGIQMKKYANA